MTVEADWSAASYWYEIVAVNPEVEVVLQGLSRNSLQGDSKVLEIFSKLGVVSKFTRKGLTLTSSGTPPKSFKYNFVNQPDLAQTVVVTCCLLNVPFSFTGLQTLKIKETDRINALITELGKLGFKLTTNDVDTLEWSGKKEDIASGEIVAIDTYEDHRMAMAFAPVASRFSSVTIKDSGVVSKSYPQFWNDLESVGYGIDRE
jgi:3-phosphoshikimate 1-carboxyvinyltransferase